MAPVRRAFGVNHQPTVCLELFLLDRPYAFISLSRARADGHAGDISATEFDAAFYAARLAGGVDVYIPFPQAAGVGEMIQKYESDAFKQTLLHGWHKPAELT